MHPPLLPNPSGEGFQFYKKRKPSRNPEDEKSPSDDAGMAFYSWAVFEYQLIYIQFNDLKVGDCLNYFCMAQYMMG